MLGPLRRSTVLLMLLVTAALCHVAAPVEGRAAVRNGRIAFSSHRDGRVDIFTMQPDGGGVRNVTDDRSPDFSPAWSPDGTHIAFVSLHADSPMAQLFIVDPLGGGEEQVTRFTDGNPQEPAWSPDGRTLAFHVSYGGAIDDELFTVDVDGSNLAQLTDNTRSDSDAAWSPDGARLAFVRDGRVETMRPDGSDVTPVTPATMLAFDPTWSPDGARIAFIGRDDPERQYDLFTVAADGSDLRWLRVTTRDELEPAWSPNGRRIVHVLVRYHEEQDTEDHLLCTVRPDGTHRRVLSADDTTLDNGPDWRY